MKITPVLIVDEVEKSLDFWMERMGFSMVTNVPEGLKIGFAILARDGAELMLQTLSSVLKDQPQFAAGAVDPRGTVLFLEVDDFADVRKRLEGYPIAVPERVMFYGMREIVVFEPAGHPVVFAAPA